MAKEKKPKIGKDGDCEGEKATFSDLFGEYKGGEEGVNIPLFDENLYNQARDRLPKSAN